MVNMRILKDHKNLGRNSLNLLLTKNLVLNQLICQGNYSSICLNNLLNWCGPKHFYSKTERNPYIRRHKKMVLKITNFRK